MAGPFPPEANPQYPGQAPGWHPPMAPGYVPGTPGTGPVANGADYVPYGGLPQTGSGTSTGLPAEYQAIIDALTNANEAAQAQAVPFGSTQAGLAQQFEQEKQLLQLQAQFGAEEGRKEFERQMQLQQMQQEYEAKLRREQLMQERQSEYANLIGKGDAVRAVLLGLGIGGELNPGAGKYEGLPALEGAQQFQTQTQDALSKLQARTMANQSPISIGQQGVTGLGSAEQFANVAQRGSEGVNQLLSSAFGVGNQGLGGGISAEEFRRRVQDVTPTGIL